MRIILGSGPRWEKSVETEGVAEVLKSGGSIPGTLDLRKAKLDQAGYSLVEIDLVMAKMDIMTV